MKKYLILILIAAAALASCGKWNLEPAERASDTITFDLTANHPDDTKAVKSSWETGDAIFVFFSGAEAPKYLKMTFNGTKWTSAEYAGATVSSGALGLSNGATGTMRAVFLPFGSDASVSASGTDFVFSKTYYTYYLTATLDYMVADNKVSGAFDMVIPDNYVQFFVEDAAAVDETYSLGCDAIIPVGVASIAADGTITETSDKTYVDDMLGYAYSGGYLFSGKLNSDYHSIRRNGSGKVEADAYYFAKTNSDGTVRHDYFFVAGKTIASHDAVKLPASSDVYAFSDGIPNKGKWIPVGSGITVKLGSFVDEGNWEAFADYGTWYTCNYNCTKPEQVGTLYSFDNANGIEGITLPTKEQFELIKSNCSLAWLTVHGQKGTVVRANSGFLLLPAEEETCGGCWSSTKNDNLSAWFFCFDSVGESGVLYTRFSHEYSVRPFQN